MPVNLIRDADIRAISIVDKGANRKRFFLFKSQRKGAWVEGCPSLPNGRLVKADDWSAVYCVVAEPGWHESPGVAPGTDQSVDDRWASEEEIRKAAYRFMANGGLVTKMHADMEPYGQLVENAIALDDFAVGGETIRKGSWYIAIEPTAEGKAAIEKGEFGGVSIEGLAVRELVEKESKGSSAPIRTVGSMSESLLRRVAKAVGLSDEEITDLEKANRTFGEIVASREFDEALPMAFDAFQSAIWNAFFPSPGEEVDPVALITESCDEFKAWTLDKLETVPVTKAERAEALGVDPEGSSAQIRTFESEDTNMGLTEKETERIDKLESAVEKIGAGVEKLIAKADAEETEEKAPTADELTKKLDEALETVNGLKADIAKLGEGGSSQVDPPTEEAEVEKAAAVKKAFENNGVDPALAGVLG